MKVSLKWMQRYAAVGQALHAPIDEVSQKIGAQLGAIEETDDLGAKYHGIVVARIVSVKKHENSDHLHICMIDDGGVSQNVTRDAQGYVQVVCGAHNVREGLLVAWLPPGAVVPETYGKEPFVLEARELRGAMSNGMLASARELALGTDHTGIIEVDADAKPGDDFATVFELDDYIINIENKMFTHRPDCFGQLGVAREIAGIFGQAFHAPEWYRVDPDLPKPDGERLALEIRNELPELVPRFTAIVMRDIAIHPSPLWLQTYLLRVGVRPINNVVDLTNYYMLLTGQPLHAYDYDKVKSLSGDQPTLVVRYPHQGESIKLLNGKTIEPRREAIMIATDKQAIGMGGVMGGAETEVDDNTKNIILECATFDMYSIRRTAMAHGLFTDAVTRFNKGQSPLQNLAVLVRVSADITQYADGQVASDVLDANQLGDRAWVHPPVPVTVGFINERLGLRLSADDMKRLLENVEFTVTTDGEQLTVTAPFWRTDIEQREDVVEEIGRLYGFDHLPLDLPTRIIEPTKKDALLDLKQQIREKLVKSGANEALTYSFVHGNLLDKVGQDKAQAFQVANALSPDLQYYRLSLTPSLLDKVHANIKAGYEQFGLFEIGKVHVRNEPDPSDSTVPKETNALSLVYASSASRPGAAFYLVRQYLETLLSGFGAGRAVHFEALADADLYDNPWIIQMVAPFEPNRSAVLRDDLGLIWGVVGEYRAAVRKNLKLPDYVAGFEIDPLLLFKSIAGSAYTMLPRFPKVEQDICLKVASSMTYNQVYECVARTIDTLKPAQTLVSLTPVDIYQRDDDNEHKQITLRLSIASYEKTMTDAEVAKMLDEVSLSAKDALQAERI